MLRPMIALPVILLCLCILAFAVLLWITRVPPEVPATVADDPALPRFRGKGVLLHGHVTARRALRSPLCCMADRGATTGPCWRWRRCATPTACCSTTSAARGLSERVTEDRLAMKDQLADLDALIAAHGGDPVLLIGHSWGAMLATAYLGHRPEVVSRAVLIEPGYLDAEGLTAFETRRTALSRSPRMIWAGLLAGFRARGVRGDAEAARDSIVGTVVHAFANHPANPYHCPGQPYGARPGA